MYRVRTTKTGSGNTAVQVVLNTTHKVNVIKHIGTGRNDQEIEDLKKLAFEYIDKLGEDEGEISMFQESNLVLIDNISIVHTLHTFVHEFLDHIYTLNGFDKLGCNIFLKDLSIMRIIEPTSKDKSDREKQIRKAELNLKTPGKFSARRPRFVKEITASKYILNEDLIASDKLKDGIKGYYTNLEDVPEELIVSRYHDLWHVEKSFRIAKSDLKARPMFHRKKDMIMDIF